MAIDVSGASGKEAMLRVHGKLGGCNPAELWLCLRAKLGAAQPCPAPHSEHGPSLSALAWGCGAGAGLSHSGMLGPLSGVASPPRVWSWGVSQRPAQLCSG